MSVYRDTDSEVVFEHPIAGPLTATVSREGETAVLYTQSDIASSGGRFTLNLPWTATEHDGRLTVVWTADGFRRTQIVEVVTPIISLAKLRTMFDAENPTDDELIPVETIVRAMIESYCGQPFGWSKGVRTYVGTGAGKIILREHCDRLIGIFGVFGEYPADFEDPATHQQVNLNGELNLSNAGLIEDGWAVQVGGPGILSIKEAPPIELPVSANGVIRVPSKYLRERDAGSHYTLIGEWGYSAVPEDVQQAALLLANDYLTGDSGYRDRYLQILKIQQDSFTYHPGAFRGTGNARVDQLLAKYRRGTRMMLL